MLRYDNQVFREGDLPERVTEVIFSHCKFYGRLPAFRKVEFHACDLGGTTVFELVDCKLFSTRLDGADFTRADVRFSITNAGSPCSARKCQWQGVVAILDCGFWGGLEGEDDDVTLFLIMALIPKSPSRERFYRSLPEKLRCVARRYLDKEFRRP